jgi:hypothetical protein
MPNAPIFRYYVDVRLSNSRDDRKSFHIDACTRTGAFYQTWKLLKKHNINEVWAVTIRQKAYPVAKAKLVKDIISQYNRQSQRVDNLETVKAIQLYVSNKLTKV